MTDNNFTIVSTDPPLSIQMPESTFGIQFQSAVGQCFFGNVQVGNLSTSFIRMNDTIHMKVSGNIPVTASYSTPLSIKYATITNPNLVVGLPIPLDFFPSLSWSKPFIVDTTTSGLLHGKIVSNASAQGTFTVYSTVDGAVFPSNPDNIIVNTVISYYNTI